MSCTGEKDDGSSQPWSCLTLLSCGRTERAQVKLWDAETNCKSQLFHPAMCLFSCLLFLGAAQAFLFQLPTVIRAETKPGPVLVPGTWDLESCKWLLGEGRAVAWPGCSFLMAFNSSSSHPSDLAALPQSSQGPWRCRFGHFSLLFLVFRVVTADALRLCSPTSRTRNGM